MLHHTFCVLFAISKCDVGFLLVLSLAGYEAEQRVELGRTGPHPQAHQALAVCVWYSS